MSAGTGPTIEEYRLRLDVDFAGLRWTGTVEFDPPPGAEPLSLDCEGLEVGAVRRDGRAVAFTLDRTTHRLAIPLGGGGGSPVAVDFAGTVETKNLFGLYRSRYGDSYILTTHCEPTGARHIFPCVDRPDRKARIALTIATDPGLDVIANAPVRSQHEENGRRRWTFAPTPRMSTYLFYLGIGRFEFREDRTGSVAIRIATPPGRGDAGAWALRSAGRILRAYEAYYGIPYPLPKLDLIAVPEHAFGAMENWGAISYQESRLLVDEGSSTFATHDVFETSAHEIAHQWFGNLVTMAWWDDIWLNESFAALMETKVTDQLEPTFDPWCDFFVRVAGKAAAIDGDSLRSTHPVRARAAQPEELSQIFDEISYGKGSSILAMLERYLGAERFRAGVTDYLKAFGFRNARTEDLFDALGRTSGEPVAGIAGPWLDRAGFPVVEARLGAGGLHLRQRRFGFGGATDEPPWPIPMTFTVDGRPQRFLFDHAEATVPVPPSATVVLNPGSLGFYRVLYDRPLLDRLLAVVPGRTDKDAWAVADDLTAFLVAGDIDWSTYAGAVERFAPATERLTVESLAGDLARLALDHPDVPATGRLAVAFLRGQLDRIGLERRPGETAGTGILRDRLLSARVRVDLPFAGELGRRFADLAKTDPDLRSAIAIGHVRSGGDAADAEVREALARARTDTDAMRLERALAWSPRGDRVHALLELGSAGQINRSHLYHIALQTAANPAGREATWRWLTERLETLAEIFRGSGYLPLVLETTLPRVGRGRAAEVRRFFEAHPTPDGTRGLAKGLERLELAERLRSRLPG